jgi:hypothetical protein
MGNLTPKPDNQHIKKKLISNKEKLLKLTNWKDGARVNENRYKKLKISINAPNCVQKNIK